MKKTKIICSLGLKTDNKDMIKKLALAGMNVCRVNMAHGDHAEQENKINNINEVRDELGIPLSVMVDIKGPDIRIRKVENDKQILTVGQKYTFTTRDILGDNTIVSVNYENLHKDLNVGDCFVVNDGKLRFKVVAIEGTEIITEVLTGGEINNTKNMNFPGLGIKLPFIREKDEKDIAFAVRMGAEYIAASFVSCVEDIRLVRAEIEKNGGKNIGIIAKIENEKGVNNAEEILSECEGLMVARGDLGNEMSFEDIPTVQKDLIQLANKMGKISITATDMLDSMIKNERPTRAEVNDIGNAVFDGTSAVMLSGETGHPFCQFPVEAVTIMNKICVNVENNINYKKRFYTNLYNINDINNTVAHCAVFSSYNLNAKGIVAGTMSGSTAKLLSKYKPACTVFALTTDKKVYHQLSMVYGVDSHMLDVYSTVEDLHNASIEKLKNLNLVAEGDPIVYTMGYPLSEKQITNTIKIEIVE